MAFCINCGQELAEGAKFCASCGNAVDASQNGAKEQRKTVYDGELHKCTTKVKAETADYVGRLRIQREEGQYAMPILVRFGLKNRLKSVLPVLRPWDIWVKTVQVELI